MKITLVFISLFSLFFVFSQESFHFERMETPFVSNLMAYSSGKQILLKWKNPPSFSNDLLIYRSNQCINRLEDAVKIAVLKGGETQYTDSVSEGVYYYAILINDRQTKLPYQFFIPYRNITMEPIVLEKESERKITALRAYANGKIHLNWEYEAPTNEEKNVYLFRNIVPIADEALLKESVPIGKVSIKERSMQDLVVPGVGYYYYILVENQIPIFLPDITYTTVSVSIRDRENSLYTNDFRQFTPLPLLAFDEDPITGKPIRNDGWMEMQNKTRRTSELEKILSSGETKEIKWMKEKNSKDSLLFLPFPYLNDESIYLPAMFPEKYKEGIRCIVEGKKEEAISLFESVLSPKLPEELYDRLNYYLGMVYYSAGQYYNSYIYLNCAKERYRKETVPYLDSICKQLYKTFE